MSSKFILLLRKLKDGKSSPVLVNIDDISHIRTEEYDDSTVIYMRNARAILCIYVAETFNEVLLKIEEVSS